MHKYAYIILLLLLTISGIFYATKRKAAVTSAPTSGQQEIYDNYPQKQAEEIVANKKDAPVEGTLAKPKSQTSNSDVSNVWVLAVSLNSLNSDLLVTDDKEGTRWMNYERFDRELTELEANQKIQYQNITAKWAAIINDPNISSKAVSEIQSIYKPIWQNKLQQLEAVQSYTIGVANIFHNRWGAGSLNVPQKYLAAYQWNIDIGLVTKDLIKMTEINLELKDKTILNIQNKDVTATVMSANDEDTVVLVASWYEDRLDSLMQKTTEITDLLSQLIKDYPQQ